MYINREAREALFTEVEGISNELLNEKPADGKWSIKQVLEHLEKMETTVAKVITDQLEDGEEVHTEPKPIEKTVNRDVKVDAPDFAIPTDEFATFEDLKRRLDDSHRRLDAVEHAADDQELEAKSYPHPVFGPMSLKQWIPFVGYHEMRHTAQIREIKESLGLLE